MATGNQRDPVVVGINRTQDGSICVMQGSRVLCCSQKERFTRRKHHWGKLGDLRDLYRPAIPALAHWLQNSSSKISPGWMGFNFCSGTIIMLNVKRYA